MKLYFDNETKVNRVLLIKHYVPKLKLHKVVFYNIEYPNKNYDFTFSKAR